MSRGKAGQVTPGVIYLVFRVKTLPSLLCLVIERQGKTSYSRQGETPVGICQGPSLSRVCSCLRFPTPFTFHTTFQLKFMAVARRGKKVWASLDPRHSRSFSLPSLPSRVLFFFLSNTCSMPYTFLSQRMAVARQGKASQGKADPCRSPKLRSLSSRLCVVLCTASLFLYYI